MPEYRGYITVCESPDERKRNVFKEFAKSQGLKAEYAMLSRGDNADQLVASLDVNVANHWLAASTIGFIAGKLEGAGYPKVRVRIDTPDRNVIEYEVLYYEIRYQVQPIPTCVPPGRTYEGISAEILEPFTTANKAGLSFNGFTGDWYLTKRCQDPFRAGAAVSFALFDVAVRDRLEVLDVRERAVILDTNPALDTGWI